MQRGIVAGGIVFCLVLVMAGAAFAAERAGADVYNSKCKMCHASGVSGAPKSGDPKWLELEKKQGIKGLLENAKKGKKAMPPKGACADCTDGELKAAIEFMIKEAKGK